MITAAITSIAIVRKKIFARNWRNPLSALFFNGISNPPYRFYELRTSGRLVHLLPQPANMGHDGIVIFKELFSPHRLKKFFGGDNDPLTLAKIPKDRKLNRGQLQFSSEQKALVIVPVDNKPSNIVFMYDAPPALERNCCSAYIAATVFLPWLRPLTG